MNAARIESTAGKFGFYLEGISNSVARVLEKVDEERCNVMKIFGVEPLTSVNWLKYAYDVTGKNLYEAIHNEVAIKGFLLHQVLHRYNRRCSNESCSNVIIW